MVEHRVSARIDSFSKPGKRQLALRMYGRGKSFLYAAVLLKRHSGHDFVVLHVLCQGIELVLKGLLLLADYDRYQPKLKGAYGHDLEKLADQAIAEFRLNPLRQELRSELTKLNELYSEHQLRYGNILDLFADPSTVKRDRVFQRMMATIRLTERILSASTGSY